MEDIVVGSVVNQVKFGIDQASWANLEKFEKRIMQLKTTMSGLNMNIRVNARTNAGRVSNMYGSMQQAAQRQAKVYQQVTSGREAQLSFSTMTDKQRKSYQEYMQNVSDMQSGMKRPSVNSWSTEKPMHQTYFQMMGTTRGQYEADYKAALKEQEQIRKKADQEAAQKAAQEKWRANLHIKNAFNEANAMRTRRERVSIRQDNQNEMFENLRLSTDQQDELRAALARVSKQYADGAITGERYNAEVQRINRSTRRLANSNKGLLERLDEVHGKLILGGAALGTWELGKSIVNVGMDLEGVQAGLIATTGSAENASKAFNWVMQSADAMGVSTKSAADSFLQLTAAANGTMKLQDVEGIFKGYTEYAKSIDISNYRYQLGLLAITQMISKGKIQAQEARRQLGENVSGAYQILQRAAGFGPNQGAEFAKAMTAGTLDVSKVLPMFGKLAGQAARRGGAYNKSLDTTRTHLLRLGNASIKASKAVFDSGLGKAVSYVADTLGLVLKVATPLASLLAHGLAVAVKTVVAPFRMLAAAVDDLAYVFGIKFDSNIWKWIADIAGLVAGLAALYKILKLIGGVLKTIAEFKLFGKLGKILSVLGAFKFARILGSKLGLDSLISKLDELAAAEDKVAKAAKEANAATEATGAGAEGGAGPVTGAGAGKNAAGNTAEEMKAGRGAAGETGAASKAEELAEGAGATSFLGRFWRILKMVTKRGANVVERNGSLATEAEEVAGVGAGGRAAIAASRVPTVAAIIAAIVGTGALADIIDSHRENARKGLSLQASTMYGGLGSGLGDQYWLSHQKNNKKSDSKDSTVHHVIDVNVHDGAVTGLIDAKVQENNTKQSASADDYTQ